MRPSSCVGDGIVRMAANVDIELLRLIDAKFVSDYKFRVWFADGFTREIDMDGELEGPVFQALKDKAVFARLRFDPRGRTVVWPNGTDLAPEFLRWGPHTGPDCPCGMERGDPPVAEHG